MKKIQIKIREDNNLNYPQECLIEIANHINSVELHDIINFINNWTKNPLHDIQNKNKEIKELEEELKTLWEKKDKITNIIAILAWVSTGLLIHIIYLYTKM